jgi:hypothetical protein
LLGSDNGVPNWELQKGGNGLAETMPDGLGDAVLSAVQSFSGDLSTRAPSITLKQRVWGIMAKADRLSFAHFVRVLDSYFQRNLLSPGVHDDHDS